MNLSTLESIFSTREKTIKDASCREIIISDDEGFKSVREKKDIISCGKIGDIEKLGKKIRIRNALRPEQVVRKIDVTKNSVIVDVLDGTKPITFDKSEPVYYEPWLFDRGSYLVYVKAIKNYGKLATEFDIVDVIEP